MKSKPLRVGFDLDGVILYNPIRIFRPFAYYMRYFVSKKTEKKFYIPRNRVERLFWRVLHKTSIWIAPGLEDIGKLVHEEKIEAYLITARYSFLKRDFDKWIDKVNTHKYFTECIYNEKDLQPHMFKEKMIEKLDLDIFVEDNWGIVKYLSEKNKKTKRKIFWITNLFDRGIYYPHKFMSLRQAVNTLQSMVK